MMDYLISNIGTIVVFLIIAAVVTLIVIKLRKDKAGGKSSCGCNCGCRPNSYAAAVRKTKNLTNNNKIKKSGFLKPDFFYSSLSELE